MHLKKWKFQFSPLFSQSVQQKRVKREAAEVLYLERRKGRDENESEVQISNKGYTIITGV